MGSLRAMGVGVPKSLPSYSPAYSVAFPPPIPQSLSYCLKGASLSGSPGSNPTPASCSVVSASAPVLPATGFSHTSPAYAIPKSVPLYQAQTSQSAPFYSSWDTPTFSQTSTTHVCASQTFPPASAFLSHSRPQSVFTDPSQPPGLPNPLPHHLLLPLTLGSSLH